MGERIEGRKRKHVLSAAVFYWYAGRHEHMMRLEMESWRTWAYWKPKCLNLGGLSCSGVWDGKMEGLSCSAVWAKGRWSPLPLWALSLAKYE